METLECRSDSDACVVSGYNMKESEALYTVLVYSMIKYDDGIVDETWPWISRHKP